MKKYIVITGGELFNKGAESMTFTLVNELKNKFPNQEIVLFSNQDYERKIEEKENYRFLIFPMNNEIVFKLLGGPYKLLWSSFSKSKVINYYSEASEEIDEIFKNTEMLFDISGFALSSQFRFGHSLEYLLRIKLAQSYDIPVYIMPQSFGPFNYKGLKKIIINYLNNTYLSYPQKIFAREKEGLNYLKELNLSNLEYSNDLVLTYNKKINKDNIYKSIPKFKEFDEINGIGIVPNMKTFMHGSKTEIISLYKSIISLLLENNKNVFLVRHSFEDIEACRLIKNEFKAESKVQIIEDDMSSFEFDNLVKKFDFLIGSRFHSLVHAYKNKIPCLALGWATKYRELLTIFEQEKYIFDVRNITDTNEILSAVENLIFNHKEDTLTIEKRLKQVQEENPFKIIN